ncbi:MAG: 30S ribosomal protein S3 [Candidatus Anammoxibacter sp.]
MGQKVNPIGFRIGTTETWRSSWYANKKDFGNLLVEDYKIRKYIKENYRFAAIPRIDIERTRDEAVVVLHTARPALIIGRKGAEIEKLKDKLEKLIKRPINIKIKEVNKPELQAQLVAENIAEQLKKRAAFRKVMKKVVDSTMQLGAKGIKLQVSGRLNGAEIARTETVTVGSIPLHTLMADIDYGFAVSFTTYGTIGVKVWIFKGIIQSNKENKKNAINA